MALQNKLPPSPPTICTIVHPVFGLVSHTGSYTHGPDPTPNRKYIMSCVSQVCSSGLLQNAGVPQPGDALEPTEILAKKVLKRLNIRRNKPCFH